MEKSLLELQLQTLRRSGIREIVLVRGYLGHKINLPGIRYQTNVNYLQNNILESLFCSEDDLNGDVIVTYSDIWYDVSVLDQLCRNPNHIALAVEPNFRKTYENRVGNPIEQAETVVFNDSCEVSKIGKIASETTTLGGEFIGMMKLTHEGCDLLKKHYHLAKVKSANKPFHYSETFEKAYLSDLLQEMVDLRVKIHCDLTQGDWKEIDTVEDYKKAIAELEFKIG